MSEVKPMTTLEIIKDYNSLPADISEVEWVLNSAYLELQKENERIKEDLEHWKTARRILLEASNKAFKVDGGG